MYNCFKSPVLRNVDEKHSPLFSLSQGYSSREGWIMQLIKLTWAKYYSVLTKLAPMQEEDGITNTWWK